MPVLIRPRQRYSVTPAARATPPAIMSVHGMLGLGDNLHQRAIIRQYLSRYNTVFLETPWPCIYHDLRGPRLQLAPRATTLRTQAKNLSRETKLYTASMLPREGRRVRVWYTGDDIRKYGSILGAMVANAECDLRNADFRLPVPETWLTPIDAMIARWQPTKPIMLYRPLVERTEWEGCSGRNPEFEAYYNILRSIRRRFFVVSIADLVPSVEWRVGRDIMADVELHRGELAFELLAALAVRATLVYCSPGFAPLLAQAVGTPSVCVFGGHESSMTIAGGARFAPTLGIDPIIPCDCFSHTHKCQKKVDVPNAIARVHDFVERTCALL